MKTIGSDRLPDTFDCIGVGFSVLMGSLQMNLIIYTMKMKILKQAVINSRKGDYPILAVSGKKRIYWKGLRRAHRLMEDWRSELKIKYNVARSLPLGSIL